MDFVTRRETAYRDLVLQGVRVRVLARSHYNRERWFVECEREDWVDGTLAKELIGSYVRQQWDGYGISFSFKPGAKRGHFICGFFSNAL